MGWAGVLGLALFFGMPFWVSIFAVFCDKVCDQYGIPARMQWSEYGQ